MTRRNLYFFISLLIVFYFLVGIHESDKKSKHEKFVAEWVNSYSVRKYASIYDIKTEELLAAFYPIRNKYPIERWKGLSEACRYVSDIRSGTGILTRSFSESVWEYKRIQDSIPVRYDIYFTGVDPDTTTISMSKQHLEFYSGIEGLLKLRKVVGPLDSVIVYSIKGMEGSDLVVVKILESLQCGSRLHTKFNFTTSIGLSRIKTPKKKKVTKIKRKAPLVGTPEIKYIKKYLPIAREENRVYGIPVSIILGQAMVESKHGTSKLSRRTNNHFGMKCFSKAHKKNGSKHCYQYHDDHPNDRFIKYRKPQDSFIAHGKLLNNSRYIGLKEYNKKLHPIDYYKLYATGLRKKGYATDKKYANKLISVIEMYQLYRFD